ncbi:MAG: hypothetical protein AAFW69_01170, partial [Pseudomonadota bacterium]
MAGEPGAAVDAIARATASDAAAAGTSTSAGSPCTTGAPTTPGGAGMAGMPRVVCEAAGRPAWPRIGI